MDEPRHLNPDVGSLESDPSCWRAIDLERDDDWVRHLNGAELKELYCAALALADSPSKHREINKHHVRLPSFGAALNRIAYELRFGRGVALLRGLDIENYSLHLLNMLCFVLGVHLGKLSPQNLDGDLLRAVTNAVTDTGESSRSGLDDDYHARGHRGRAEMLPHSDSADIVGLLCVRQAKQGGATALSSSRTVYREIMKTRPELLSVLHNGFYFDMTGKSARGFSECRVPVFWHADGRPHCQFNRSRIEAGMKKAGLSLGKLEIAALDYMNELALRPDLALSFDLRAGDVLLLNNHCTLHAREKYEDWPQPDRKRVLLRFWVNWVP